MAIFTKDATELAMQIMQSLRGSGFIHLEESEERSALDTIIGLLGAATFPSQTVRTTEVTILLSDIRGFSAIAETYPARDVVSLLNRYFDCMGERISKYGGHIDKLMGDSILVIFGIENPGTADIENAIACAVEMQLAMNDLNVTSEALGMPALYMGIALNTGPVVIGDLGSRHYSEYTVIGEEVNLTSRIEAHCLRGQILLSENTYTQAKDYIEVGPANLVEVKGVRKAIKLYELFATHRPAQLQVPRREGRKSPRIKVNMPAVFQRLNGKIVLDDKYEGEVIDISYNGLLVQTELLLAKSSEIKMSLALDLFSNRTTDVYARIIRTEAIANGYRSNMEFTTIDKEGLLTIKQYVDQLVTIS